MILPFHSFSGGDSGKPSKPDAEVHAKALEIKSFEETVVAVPASTNDLEEIIMFEGNSGSDAGAENDEPEGEENPKGSGLEMYEGDDEPMSLTDLSSGFQALSETRKARLHESNSFVQVKPFDYAAARKQVRFGEDAKQEESRGKEDGLDCVSKKRTLGKGRVQAEEDGAGEYQQGRRRQAFPASGNRSATFRSIP